MTPQNTSPEQLLRHENEALRARLEEAEQIINALRHQEVDALVVSGPHGDQVHTIETAERPYHLLVENAIDYAIVTLDPAGCYNSWNAGAERILGYTEPEILGQPSAIIFTPEDRERCIPEKEMQTALAAGQAEDERWHVRRNGSLFYASGVITPFINAHGRFLGYVKIMRDLTERKQAEEALSKSEERYRLTVENIRDYAIFTLDTRGHVTSWNEGARRVKGYQLPEIIGHHFRVFYTEEDQQARKPERELEDAAATGRHEDESWRVRNDGSQFWGNEICTAMRGADGTLLGFVKISRDMTERKRSEEERVALEHETTLLMERNRMAQELHDTLAQGFTSIKMQLEMAQLALQTAPPEVDEGVHRLVRATEIARQCHQEARSSIRALRSPLLENATLVDAFERLTNEVADGIEVAFTVEGTPYALSALVENDIYRIGQEALTNALRHGAAQHVAVTLAYFEDQVHLTIQDDGRGFDTKSGRTGFGITGIQERALRLGGQWRLRSEPGQGTQVRLIVTVGKQGVHPKV
jgi:PAS domain S-box-containing protein